MNEIYNDFYYELLDRGETQAAANYLRYLRGELKTESRRSLIGTLRITETRRKILTIVGSTNLPCEEDIIRNFKKKKMKTVESDIEILVTYGYLDEEDGIYSLTEQGQAIHPIALDERICEEVRDMGVFTIPDLFHKIKVDRTSSLRSAIRKLVKRHRIEKVSRGHFVSAR
jgi:hypothetical protein